MFMDIEIAIQQYLDWKKEYHPSAWKSYQPFLKKFSIYFQGRNVYTIDINSLLGFMNTLKPIYADRTVWYMSTILRNFFSFHRGLINPYHIKTRRIIIPEIKYVTQEDFTKMDQALDEWKYMSLRLKLIHHLLWSTGVRVGELCTITLDDIDLPNKMAKIVTEKSKRKSYIMWNERTHELLVRYLGVRLSYEGDSLFLISQREIQRNIKKLSEQVGLTGITPHKYRHGKAHKMLSEGASIDEIAFVLRHVDPKMTKQMYLRLDKNENMSIMSKYVTT